MICIHDINLLDVCPKCPKYPKYPLLNEMKGLLNGQNVINNDFKRCFGKATELIETLGDRVRYLEGLTRGMGKRMDAIDKQIDAIHKVIISLSGGIKDKDIIDDGASKDTGNRDSGECKESSSHSPHP